MQKQLPKLFSSINYYFPVFLGIVAVVFTIYFDGILYSTFLLDDFVNFKGLNSIKGLSDIEGILGYTLNGVSGKSGRPISLFTFALQANSWPDNPFYFKLVNFAIHIINGYLAYSLILLIYRSQQKTISFRYAQLIALLGAFVWLIHPIQVSTVLYSVQRMTELSALFVFAGLLAYLKGRELLDKNDKTKKGYIYISTGIILGGFLGVLAKENAILLCLYIIVIEATLYKNRHFQGQVIWSSVLLYIPLAILFGYLILISTPYIYTEYPLRTFSATERLLTEFRVVTDYILLFFIPSPNQLGLFHTDYKIITDAFDTRFLFPFILIISLLSVGYFTSKSHPIFSFGLLLFFSSHALESTFLNLEIYFEHRNYFGILGLIICILYVINKIIISSKFTKLFRYTSIALMSVWIVILSIITYKEVDLWSKPILQAETWYIFNKDSERARTNYNFLLTLFGFYQEAYQNNKEVFYSDINAPGEILMWAQLRCFDESIPYPPYDIALDKLKDGIYTNAVLASLDDIATMKNKGNCQSLDNVILIKYIEAVSKSKHYQRPNMQRTLLILRSKFLILEKDYEQALQTTSNANSIKETIDTLINIAYLHYMLGKTDSTEFSISRIDTFCQKNPIECIKFKNEIATLKTTINKNSNKQILQ